MWRPTTIEDIVADTATARTLRFAAPGWDGHVPGQHVDLRVTAPDGYTAVRPYSIGSAPALDTFDLTIEETPGGEVSPFLTQSARPGASVEIRGPLGRWFVWRPEQEEPVQLIAGGSGVVPLMSMLRTHRNVSHPSPMRLLYSVRSPSSTLYAGELGDDVTVLYTREAPTGSLREPHRLQEADVTAAAIPAVQRPQCFVCGPTPFVETAIELLVRLGHDPTLIRAERFGAGRN
jgi:ferredoxin-NADP reductase